MQLASVSMLLTCSARAILNAVPVFASICRLYLIVFGTARQGSDGCPQVVLTRECIPDILEAHRKLLRRKTSPTNIQRS